MAYGSAAIVRGPVALLLGQLNRPVSATRRAIAGRRIRCPQRQQYRRREHRCVLCKLQSAHFNLPPPGVAPIGLVSIGLVGPAFPPEGGGVLTGLPGLTTAGPGLVHA